jgi:hypothetical protein
MRSLLISKFNNNTKSDYYFKSIATKKLHKVEQLEGKKQKVVIDLQEYNATIPSTIKIKHKKTAIRYAKPKAKQTRTAVFF